MLKSEWASSNDARWMLSELHQHQPEFLVAQVPQLHRFFIACSWKHKHLIPQKHLRKGLLGAEKWLAGELTNDQLNELNWYSEAEVFMILYAKTQEDFDRIRALAAGIEELRGLPFDEAKAILLEAAHFAEMSMIYSHFRRLPWVKSLFTSRFLCADLLRAHIVPEFAELP